MPWGVAIPVLRTDDKTFLNSPKGLINLSKLPTATAVFAPLASLSIGLQTDGLRLNENKINIYVEGITIKRIKLLTQQKHSKTNKHID